MTVSTPVRPDASRIAALHHPVRRRLVELLALEGPATVSRLAQRSDQGVGNVSHHLKILARADLVAGAPELARDKRERWWRRVPVAMSWSVADVGDNVADRIVAEEAEQENLAYHADKVQQWFRRRHDYDETWVRAAYSADSWLTLTADELTELSRRIDLLVRDFGAEVVDDAQPREHVFVFTHAVPATP